MSATGIEGKISFINHDKQYAIIEYMQGGKKRTANGLISPKQQQAWKQANLIKKTHVFSVGDVVTFNLKLSDRGDKMVASAIQFRYNTALDVLINKAATDNKFIGYLKEVEGKYFVKEIESYLFFPVPLSPWQLPPDEQDMNEQVTFSLSNLEKKDKITAVLFNNNYIPEFSLAVKAFKAKTPVPAKVERVTPHGVYVSLFDGKMQGKIGIEESLTTPAAPQPGDDMEVLITYLGKDKIVLKQS